MKNYKKTKVIFLCFHYLKRSDAFKRIWGYDFALLKNNIDFLLKDFPPVAFQQLNNFLRKKTDLPLSCSILSFDDGLKEHFEIIAPYLASKNISAVFSVPTCIFQEQMASPQVIHFTTAKYGIRNFYKFCKEYFSVTGLNFTEYFDPAWEKLNLYSFYSKVKNVLLYKMQPLATEKLLRTIFLQVLQKNHPDILESVYLNKKGLSALTKMGHTIACHTHSHFSLRKAEPSEKQWQKEIIEAKQILESITNQKVNIFSYPYGSSKDKFNFNNWTQRLRAAGFSYAFNAYRELGDSNVFEPYWIERYSVGKDDTPEDIKNNFCSYTI